MALSSHPALPESASVIDPESAVEVVRLLNQGRLLSSHMGGVLPEHRSSSAFGTVLDVACGPGAWALDLASHYPHTRVTGIDISESAIGYARSLARELSLNNARFCRMDATHSLQFPNASFDLINAAFLAEFMPKASWPAFLRECQRVLRPGGTIRLTEEELGFSNSPAHEHFRHLYLQAMGAADFLLTANVEHVGIINGLEPLLRKTGFAQTDYRIYAVNYASDAPLHEAWCQNVMLRIKLTLPFLARMGVATRDELERLAARIREEMYAPNFCALWLYLTVWGIKTKAKQDESGAPEVSEAGLFTNNVESIPLFKEATSSERVPVSAVVIPKAQLGQLPAKKPA